VLFEERVRSLPTMHCDKKRRQSRHSLQERRDLQRDETIGDFPDDLAGLHRPTACSAATRQF